MIEPSEMVYNDNKMFQTSSKEAMIWQKIFSVLYRFYLAFYNLLMED